MTNTSYNEDDDEDDPETRAQNEAWNAAPLVGHVAVLPGLCWRCGAKVRPIVGMVTCRPDDAAACGFVPFDECAEFLMASLSPTFLASLDIGAIRPRTSRMGGRYLSNGCSECDAIQGTFPLEERLNEYTFGGGLLAWLPRIARLDLPSVAVYGWYLSDAPAQCYTILGIRIDAA